MRRLTATAPTFRPWRPSCAWSSASTARREGFGVGKQQGARAQRALGRRGPDLRFWHLSFQEYLAAREIASLAEKQQIERVVESGKLYRPEWREMMRLLGGVLRQQGEAKIEGFFQAVLDRLPEPPALADQARCAALLGAMMRDLSRMGYQPKTPDYERTVKTAMRIFDAKAANQIDIKTRIEAADALGQVGDPRLEEDNWVTIPAGTFRMGAQKQSKKGQN